MKNKEIDLFYLRAHVTWHFFAISSLLFLGCYLADILWKANTILYWLHIGLSYAAGAFLGINMWSLLELFLNRERYIKLMKHFDDVVFCGFVLRKLIMIQKMAEN